MALVRLQKFLAEAGVASRRACEELILDGRVSIDGQQIRELGTKVDPEISRVEVDGEPVSVSKSKTYIAFYKPRGVLSTMEDPQGRSNLGDYFADRSGRIFHIGRLDKDSEGLLLLTNDGELTHRATHPSYGLTKKYLVEVEGSLDQKTQNKILTGVDLEDGLGKADSVKKIRDTKSETSWYEIVIHEGRYHIVRRIFEELGHKVITLIRTDFGPINIGDIKPGRFRHLNAVEIDNLFNALSIK
jgi:23S rRNA pseudouridine2605 synthase